jgi:serine phosphatase RsbU (regulator of sigma subunit)
VSLVRQPRTQLLREAPPLVIMAGVALAVTLVRQAFDALSLLSLGPAFATLAGEFLYTVVTGGIALVLWAVLAGYRHLAESWPGLVALAAVAGITVAGTLATAGVRRRKRQVAQLAAIAEVTQRVLLRPVPQRAGPLRLAVGYMSASSGARIGGDLYDTVRIPGGLRLIVGDAQGKGLPAVQTAATVLGAFREAAYDEPSLTRVAERIEISLGRQAATERFVTAILAQVSTGEATVTLLNRGHPPPLLLSRGTVRFCEPAQTALPLGLAEVAQLPSEPATVVLGEGDSLLFYTDGVSESRSREGKFFPIADSLALCDGGDPATVLARLSHELLCHAGHPLNDDAAMLLIRRS